MLGWSIGALVAGGFLVIAAPQIGVLLTERRPTTMAGVATAALVGAATIVFFLLQARRPPDATAPAVVSDPRIARAFQLRQSGDLDGAITALTQVLNGSAPQPVSARAARHRGYVYKLQKNWPFSIADLGTARR